jgi:hypothetical protein
MGKRLKSNQADQLIAASEDIAFATGSTSGCGATSAGFDFPNLNF